MLHPHFILATSIASTLLQISTVQASDSVTDNLRPEHISIQELYAGFQNPPAEARPFVRWWWSNNQIEIGQVEQELDAFNEAGIGGVEINPILDPTRARLRKKQSNAPILDWLSPEWNELLRESAIAAEERDMIVDLLGGSGWPFGGHFLKPEETAYRLVVHHDTVTGPVIHIANPEEIFKRKVAYLNKQYGKHSTALENFAFIKLLPRNLGSFEDITTIEPQIDENGQIQIEVPEGEYIIAYGVLEQNFRFVGNAVNGANGPALNHFSESATQSYMDRIFSIEESWGEPLANHIRAIFSDSIEIAESNYTPGMLEEFKEVYGYDIVNYLPLALMPQQHTEEIIELAPEQFSELRRARYDWFSFVTDQFLSGFTRPFTDYIDARGMQARYQSGGNPVFMAIQEGSMIAHIPEAENWLNRHDYLTHPAYHSKGWRTHTVNAKYNVAAANLLGKRIVSAESMTNVADLFKATLGQMKQALDVNFIAGLNHMVLHGATYSPPDVPFPGLIRFGTFFSPNNTWWPHFRMWADYCARLSYVFQNTRTIPEVAVIGPRPDVWANSGLSKVELSVTPRYYGDLWKTFAELGINNDYIHDTILQDADVSRGSIAYGAMDYQVLFVIESKAIEPETAEAIQELSEAGGTVVFVGCVPEQAPGMMDANTRDARVVDAINASLRAGAMLVEAPDDHQNMNHLRTWLSETLDEANYTSSLSFEDPREGIFATRKALGESELLFIVNTHRQEAYQTEVHYELGNQGLWKWDPENGEASAYRLPHTNSGFTLELAPLESILLVTGPKHDVSDATFVYDAENRAQEIQSRWNVDFAPIQDAAPFQLGFDDLEAFESHSDSRVRQFAGVATYKTEFELQDTSFTHLELGDINDHIAEIILNGQVVGVNWYGSKRFDVSEHLRPGTNSLTIHYTTTLFNGMQDDPMFLDLLEVWKFIDPTTPASAGLLGPIRLIAD